MQYATFIIIGQGSATNMFTRKKDWFKIYFDWLNQHLPCHVKLLVSDWIVKLCMARPFAVEKLPRGHSVTTLSVNRAVLHGCHCTRRRNVQSMEGHIWPPNIVSIKVYFGVPETSRSIEIKPIQCKTGKELSVASKVFIKVAEGQIKRFKMTQSYWTWMTIIWHMSDFRKLCHWLGSDVLFADHIFALTLTSVRPHMWQGGEKIKCSGSVPENATRGGDRWW